MRPNKSSVVRIVGNKRAKSDGEHAELMRREINNLARVYREQGYKILDKFPFTNEKKQKIMEVTGLTKTTVDNYLSNEYKQEQRRPIETQGPKIPASERIEHELGEEYVERHRKEVLEQETPRIKEQTKKRGKVKDPSGST